MNGDRLLHAPRPELGNGPRCGRLLALGGRLDGPDPAGLFGALHGMRCLLPRAGDLRRLLGELAA